MLELDKTNTLIEEAHQLIQSGGLLDLSVVERLSRELTRDTVLYPLIGGALGAGVGTVLRAVAPTLTRGPLGALTAMVGSVAVGAYLGERLKTSPLMDTLKDKLSLLQSTESAPPENTRGQHLLTERLGLPPGHPLVESILCIDALERAQMEKLINLSMVNLAQLICVAFEEHIKRLVQRQMNDISEFLNGKGGEHYRQRLSEYIKGGACTLGHIEALLYALKRIARAGALPRFALPSGWGEWLELVELDAVRSLRELRNDAAHGRPVQLSQYEDSCRSLLGLPSFTQWFNGEGAAGASWFDAFLAQPALADA